LQGEDVEQWQIVLVRRDRQACGLTQGLILHD
jgi:hypothetical protein